jgi:triosephosphate isomerase
MLYGGSVGSNSVHGLLAKPDIDGALDAAKFGRIVNYQEAAVLV